MHEDSPILLTVYAYADGYRFTYRHELTSVDQIDRKLFLHRMAKELVGFRAVSTFGVVKEWWGTADKKDLWASAKDGEQGELNSPEDPPKK